MVLILSILYNASILAGIVTRPVVSACQYAKVHPDPFAHKNDGKVLMSWHKPALAASNSSCNRPPVDTTRRKRIHRLCRGHQHFHEQPATTDTTLPPAARVGHRGIHYSVSEGFQTECQIQGLVDNAKSTCAIDGGTLRYMLLQPSLSNVLLDALDSFIVVEREGQIITRAALFPFYEDECGEVAAIAVSHDCRGQGQGDKLLDYIEKKASSMRLQSLFLHITFLLCEALK
ncbi:hypothetical protein CTI12_AA335020 [Artemisia annua]|uniref:N-acetyltransferase domain-containing protein n=1 Tax=Artemisia annua TaxID=35608 RepID=A0A2U1MU02_ARTAN|nr:hypothetical protein CTI12_AA335020 [Artemisia annua]